MTLVRIAAVLASLALASAGGRARAQDAATGEAAARDACGAAAFAAAEVEGAALDSFTIELPNGLTRDEVTRRLLAELEAGSARAQRVAAGYESAIRCRSPRWAIASYARQAEHYETLQRALARAFARAGLGTDDQARDALASLACTAVVRRVLAVRSARAALGPPVPHPWLIDRAVAQRALDALVRVPLAEITHCVDGARRTDPSFMRFALPDLAPLPAGE